LTAGLHHEFLRCQDAFDRFCLLGTYEVLAEESDRKSAYQLYNAYSQFVHHLYEFYKGIIELEKRRGSKFVTDKKIDEILDQELEKAIRNRRIAIENGYAPKWENGIECYPAGPQTGFGGRFRIARNVAFGHVSEDRTEIDLSDFFEVDHGHLMILFYQAQLTWRLRQGDFPDFGAVTKFQTRVLGRQSGLQARKPPNTQHRKSLAM
jgi:hypothetical protein